MAGSPRRFRPRGDQGLPNPNDPDAILDRCLERLRLKTQSHIDAWGLGSTERCDVDLDKGIIAFSGPTVLVTAPMQVIGCHDDSDGFWLWGWGNPTVAEAWQTDALRVRDFGERFGLSRFTIAETRCTEAEAWLFTALACELGDGSGAYSLPVGDERLFMTFHQVTIHRLD